MKLTKKHSTNRKGDLAEYYAVTWLWDNGYEVFKNCGCDGFIDLVGLSMKTNQKLDNVVKDNYNKFTSESGHWYTQDGEPMYTNDQIQT